MKTCPTTELKIYIAGDLATITHQCRIYCNRGLCVTITPCDFAFTGGLESGAMIGLIAYPRFPKSLQELFVHAEQLAKMLMHSCSQRSCTVVTPTESIYLENPEIEVPR